MSSLLPQERQRNRARLIVDKASELPRIFYKNNMWIRRHEVVMVSHLVRNLAVEDLPFVLYEIDRMQDEYTRRLPD